MDILKSYGINDRYINEASMYSELQIARVVAQYKGMYKIICSDGEMLAEISGKLWNDINENAMYPTVGDFVMVKAENGTCIIHNILSRKSMFIRKGAGTSNSIQLIAANIDILFICMSVNNNYNLNRLERYLSIAWDSGAKPIIILTKTDLCDDLEFKIQEVQEKSGYCDVLNVCTIYEDITKKFEKYLKIGVTAAFIGSSGVGKSTIINSLITDDVLKTCDIRKDDKGRHTTTTKEMFICKCGGVLIDTPGMREIGVVTVDLEKSFDDIESLSKRCRFSDCSHTNEPGCAILKAKAEGKIDQRRLQNYFKLKNEAGYDGLTSKEIEQKKCERMFKDIGGMKNYKKFVSKSSK